MELKRVFKDGGNLFVGKAGAVVFGTLNMVILTRIFTKEEMGIYSLFLMVVNLILYMGLHWSNSSIVRHGRSEFVKDGKINKSFWARMYLFIPAVIFFIVIFLLFSKSITNYIGISQGLIVFVIGMFVLNGIMNSIISIYQSIDKMKTAAYILFFQKLFYFLGLLMVFFNVFETKISLVLMLINFSFLLSIFIYIVPFKFKFILPYNFDKKYFKKIWSYSWPQLIGFSGIYAINYIDLYVIKQYATLADVGVYSVAYNGFTMICGFIMLIHSVFLPLVVEYKTKKKYGMISKYMKKLPLFSVGWLILVIVGTFVSKYFIQLLFSAKYLESTPSFNILLIASFFYFVSIYLLPIVNAYDLILYSQIFNIVTAIINIIFDFLLVPNMGIIGAAYGTLISFAVGTVLSITLITLNRKKIFFRS
jgi:O-antigen/teichoic acid export membrane protein